MPTKRKELPVLFRAEKSGQFKGQVTAVFPTLPADRTGMMMTVYSHVGQHSGGSHAWYAATRKATPEEYAPLLSELKNIYEEGEDPVSLTVYQRMSRSFTLQCQRAAKA